MWIKLNLSMKFEKKKRKTFFLLFLDDLERVLTLICYINFLV